MPRPLQGELGKSTQVIFSVNAACHVRNQMSQTLKTDQASLTMSN